MDSGKIWMVEAGPTLTPGYTRRQKSHEFASIFLNLVVLEGGVGHTRVNIPEKQLLASNQQKRVILSFDLLPLPETVASLLSSVSYYI